jgi:hypothetical protein
MRQLGALFAALAAVLMTATPGAAFRDVRPIRAPQGTHLESFLAQSDRLLVEEVYPGDRVLGETSGSLLNPALHVQPLVLSTPGPAEERVYGFRLEVLNTDARTSPPERRPVRAGYLDLDEATRLVSALERMGRMASTPAPADGKRVSNAEFETRGRMLFQFAPDARYPALLVWVGPPGRNDSGLRLLMPQVAELREALARGAVRLREEGAR